MITKFMRNFYIYSVCVYNTKTSSWQCYTADKWENIYKPYFDNYCYGPTWFWRYYQKGIGVRDMNITVVRHSRFASTASINLKTAETLTQVDYLKIVENRENIKKFILNDSK